MALILQIMAERNRKISELAGSFPVYSMIKEKVSIDSQGSWMESVKAAFDGQEIDDRDGVKIIFTKSWVHVRESNTEPVVRIIAEAPCEDELETLNATSLLIGKVRDIITHG